MNLKTVGLIFLFAILLLAGAIYGISQLFLFPNLTNVQAHKVFDFNVDKNVDRDYDICAGPNNEALVLVTNLDDKPDTIVTMKNVKQQQADGKIHATVYHQSEGKLHKFEITDLPGPFPRIQPLGPDAYLAITLSRYRATNGESGYVFDKNGKLQKRLKLGIDINQMQCDSQGNIWVGYDCERNHQDQLNRHGLVRFDREGNANYVYDNDFTEGHLPFNERRLPDSHHESIVLDKRQIAYAKTLNVVSDDDIYFCPRRSGDLIRLQLGQKQTRRWIPYSLSTEASAIAVYDRTALQDHHDGFLNSIYAVNLDNHKRYVCNPVDENDKTISWNSNKFAARGSRLYFSDGKSLYYLDAKEVPAVK